TWRFTCGPVGVSSTTTNTASVSALPAGSGAEGVVCGAFDSDQVTVTFRDNPTCSINPENPSICGSSGSVQLTARPSRGSGGPFSYQWSHPSGALIPGANTPPLDATEAGEYCVTVPDSNNCDHNCCIDVKSSPIPCEIGPPVPVPPATTIDCGGGKF